MSVQRRFNHTAPNQLPSVCALIRKPWAWGGLALTLTLALPAANRAEPIHQALINKDPRAVAKAIHDDPTSVNAVDAVYGTPLQLAVDGGREDMVKLLLAKGAKLDVFTAAGLGKSELLEKMLKDSPQLANARTSGGFSPLAYAVSSHQLGTAKVLLDHRADVNALSGPESGFHAPALFSAVFNGDTAMVQLLLERGADIHLRERPSGDTILHNAVYGGLQMMELLLDPKLDVNARNDNDDTPLHEAATAGKMKIVQLLLDHGAEIDAKNKQGHTPVYAAVFWGEDIDAREHDPCMKVAEFLLGKGAKSNFYIAVCLNHVEQAEAMLKQNPKLSQGMVRETAPLVVASRHGFTAMAKLLLDHGGGDDQFDKDCSLVAAAQGGYRDIAAMLLDRGASTQGEHTRPALVEAIYSGQTDMVRFLLDHKAAFDWDDPEYANNPFVLAARGGHLKMLKMLFAAEPGAAHVRVNGGWTVQDAALWYAVVNGRQEVAAMLLDRGVPIWTNLGDSTLLADAARNGHCSMMALLLDKDASINEARRKDGNTALHEAAQANQLAAAEWLLGRGADLKARNAAGDTPLHLAAAHADLPLVQLLLKHGADPKAVNKAGKLPWQLADEQGQDEIADCLRKAAEKP